MSTRSALRQSLLGKRRSLPVAAIQDASQKIAASVCVSAIFQASTHIACYIATRGEVDVAFVMQRAWELGKMCYLPLLDPQHPDHLVFVAHHRGDPMQSNRYGILEPLYSQTKVIAPSALDLVITPLVAFDAEGNRLGHGKGYYDRTFAFKAKMLHEHAGAAGIDDAQRHASQDKPFLLGVAYGWQKVAHLASAPWDVRLDMVITEENIYQIA
jgi:5-formyltetrahydrofolate cyclo-ligase